MFCFKNTSYCLFLPYYYNYFFLNLPVLAAAPDMPHINLFNTLPAYYYFYIRHPLWTIPYLLYIRFHSPVRDVACSFFLHLHPYYYYIFSPVFYFHTCPRCSSRQLTICFLNVKPLLCVSYITPSTTTFHFNYIRGSYPTIYIPVSSP